MSSKSLKLLGFGATVFFLSFLALFNVLNIGIWVLYRINPDYIVNAGISAAISAIITVISTLVLAKRTR